MNVTVTKYYTMGKWSDPVRAQKEVNRLQERHPDRKYTLLRNMRAAYSRYIVAQVKEVEVNVPTPEELYSPEPERVRFSSEEDFQHEYKRWSDYVRTKQAPALAQLKEKLNP